MRALWKGSLNFGLINIPVSMFSAAEERGGIELDYLHKEDLTPIRYVRVCTKDGKEIPFQDIVKGYEYKEGAYVVLNEEDFERANLRAVKTIDVHEFSEMNDIDPMYCDKPYFLVPVEGGGKAYELLRRALEQTGKVGIVTYVFRGRGRLGFIRQKNGVIALQRLRYTEEVRSPSAVDVPEVTVREKEVEIAKTLIEYLSQPFRMEDYRDTYTEELKRVIDKKVRGERIAGRKGAVAGQQPSSPEELMKLLRASLNKEKGRFTRAKNPARKTERKAKVS